MRGKVNNDLERTLDVSVLLTVFFLVFVKAFCSEGVEGSARPSFNEVYDRSGSKVDGTAHVLGREVGCGCYASQG